MASPQKCWQKCVLCLGGMDPHMVSLSPRLTKVPEVSAAQPGSWEPDFLCFCHCPAQHHLWSPGAQPGDCSWMAALCPSGLFPLLCH